MRSSEAEWIIKLLKEYDKTVQNSKIESDYGKSFYKNKIHRLIEWVKFADSATSTERFNEIQPEVEEEDLTMTVSIKRKGLSAREILEKLHEPNGTEFNELDEEENDDIIF